MPRAPRRENTARNVRNRLMIDHSPPRDMRKRKFQKLDRTSSTHSRDPPGCKTFTTGPVPSIPQATSRNISTQLSTCNGEAGDDLPGSLPVKNKVCHLFDSYDSSWNNM